MDQAIYQWNGVTDQYGNKTCYFLQLTSSLSNADIKIEPTNSADGGCGDDDANSGNHPETINITRSLASTYDQTHIAQLRGLIDHELGHTLGLAEGSGCPEGSTVMTGYYAGSVCVQRTLYVQASDIAKSNQNCKNRATCDKASSNQQLPIVPDPTCLTNNGCEAQSFYGEPGTEPDTCAYPSNAGCPDYLISVQGATGPCCTIAYSPIVIDVSGKGFDLTNAKHGVEFDLWGVNDGSKEQVAWTAPRSMNAWLALDRNGDGMITSGAELFGDRTAQPPSTHRNGFLALAEFDKPENGGNGDGVIDEKDSVYSRLVLWWDVNHNGISETGELHSLMEFGVSAISLTTEETPWQDKYGNKFLYRARIVRTTPFSGGEWAYDVGLSLK